MVQIFSISNCDGDVKHNFDVKEIILDESSSNVKNSRKKSKYWIKALKYIDDMGLNEPVLILTCVKSSISYDILENILEQVNKVKYDICYLGYWMEKCHKLEVSRRYKNFEICRGIAPNGAIALYIKPKIVKLLCGRSEFPDGRKFTVEKSLSCSLKEEIRLGTLKSVVVYPPPFNMQLSTNLRKVDYLKLNPCSFEAMAHDSDSEPLSIFWYIGIVVTVFVVFSLIIIVEKIKYFEKHEDLE